MKHSRWLGWMVLLGLAAGFACQKAGNVASPGTGSDTTKVTSASPDSLVLTRVFPPLLANGADRDTITATVVNAQGHPLSGVGVAFTTNHGAIDPFATTDAQGVAHADLTSEASATDLTATIQASASTGQSGTLATQRLHFFVSRSPLSPALIQKALAADVGDQSQVLMKGITLVLSANPATVPADGISVSRLVATLSETTSGVPLANQNLRFGATYGSISGREVTDTSGVAVARLVGAPGLTTSQITVFYGSGLQAQTNVTFTPLTLTVAPGSASLLADGTSSTPVVASLVTQSGNPVVGAQISFSTTAGTIPATSTSDSRGHATAVLVSSGTPGTAQITAQFSADLSASTQVAFVAPGPDSLGLGRAFRPLLANGVDRDTITASVIDGQGHPLAGVAVLFSTNHGTIDPTGTTDARGIAQAYLTSAASATDLNATIQASAAISQARGTSVSSARVLVRRGRPSSLLIHKLLSGNIGDQAQVLMKGVNLVLTANPATVPADGISASRLVAALVETTSGVPMSGQSLRFGATFGTITGQATTDNSGTAVAQLVGSPGLTASQVTVYYGPSLQAQTNVVFSPLSLTVAPGSASLLADGASSTPVVADLVTQSGNPVVGAQIKFSTTAGTISAQATSDAQGHATAVLVSSSTPGTAQITAQFSADLSANTQVVFVAAPPAATLSLHASPASLPADGASTASLVATALDANSNPVPDGTLVQFAMHAGTGSIIGPSARTIAGVATSEYMAGTLAGVDSIRATSGSAVARLGIPLLPLSAGTLTLSAQPASILADGIAFTTITALVTDQFGHPVAPGTTVEFATSRGNLTAVTPTDPTGHATARLSAVRAETGVARVTAGVPGLQQTTDVHFVSGAPANIQVRGVDYPRIGVHGSPDRTESTTTFEVQDQNGIPVDADHAATLQFSVLPGSGATDATVFPSSATTNDRGQAAATVNAGIISGAIELQAAAGGLLSQPVDIAIHGDLPDPAHFSIAFTSLNVAGLVYYGLRDQATALVGDAHGNPVPDSTMVWFSSNFGLIQGSAQTDSHGESAVDAITAAPAPVIPGGDGLVQICAQTVSKSGNRIQTCGQLLWSGPTIVEVISPAGGYNVPNGGDVVINYRVRDANNNPLTGGTRITVTATRGALSGDVSVVLPDTQDPNYTNFQVVLSDDDPTIDLAAAVTVTIQVTSQNGDHSASISGTIH